ncbi:MAG: Gfo/Idh/MocA family oxidoreductase [Armatimonadetes bacterium]|nr:Gfo/Idh/MocA family oxidoreductase [Armatimonadota bacterium]
MGSAAAIAATGLPKWFVEEAAAKSAVSRTTSRKFGPNDQINIAVIGAGGSKGGFKQGLHDTQAAAGHPGVKVIGACDVDATHLAEALAAFGKDCKSYKDYRDLLAREDLDAVVIGTPDHWHTNIAIAAMKAGKDVYCEKPLTLTIDEGKKIVRVWKETGAIFQTGSQQRSDAKFRLACELVRNGRIGKIQYAEAHLPTGPEGGPFEPTPIPSDLDWDMWLGPAPETQYVKERTHGSFRWWLEYSGGMMTDWGAHHNDIAQWGLGRDRSGPVSTQAMGKGPTICSECYSTFPEFDVLHTYEDGITLRTTNKGQNGVHFQGEDGWIFVSRGVLKASDQKLLDEPLPENAERLYFSDDHTGNWLDCIRKRDRQPICDAEIGHRSVSVCHLGNISLRLGGRKLEWDPKREVFKGDKEANAMLSRPMRRPYDRI